MPDDAMNRQASDVLPEWDLSDLFPDPESPELRACLDDASRDAQDFQKRLKGRLADLSGQELGEAIAEYEVIDRRHVRILQLASHL